MQKKDNLSSFYHHLVKKFYNFKSQFYKKLPIFIYIPIHFYVESTTINFLKINPPFLLYQKNNNNNNNITIVS